MKTKCGRCERRNAAKNDTLCARCRLVKDAFDAAYKQGEARLARIQAELGPDADMTAINERFFNLPQA